MTEVSSKRIHHNKASLLASIERGRVLADQRRSRSSIPVDNAKASKEMLETFNEFSHLRATVNSQGL